MKDYLILGKLLILKNVITPDILDAAIKKDKLSDVKRPIDQILISDFNVDREKIYTEIAKLYAIQKVEINADQLSDQEIDNIKDLLEKLPKELYEKAIESKIIPFKILPKRNNALAIIASNPRDTLGKEIANVLNFNRYEILYCPFSHIEGLIKRLNQDDNEYLKILEKTDEIDINAIEESTKEDEEALIDQEINKGALVYLFEAALIEGVKNKVSDIHIVPSSNTSIDIRFRIDGKLHLWKKKENINPQAFLAVVKDRSKNVDRFKIDTAQDGYIQRDIDGHTIRFRVSILPIVAKQNEKHYESIVIRILDDRNVIKDLVKLGLLPQAKIDFVNAITKPQGLIIITGPTGSGKSTTLLATLYNIITPEKNILTVEDPVEYVIEGARQIKISNNLNFDQAIRAILRHDPDVVMVGEIRDKASAEIAIKLANTGHLTLSTLHTNDAPSAVGRLYKMGVETFLIANAINIIVAQRLVRALCQDCKTKVTEDEIEYYERYGVPGELIKAGKIYKPVGCEKCRGTGYKGRRGIHEALYFTKELRRIILNSKEDINEDEIRELAVKNGMLSLRQSAIELVKRGDTSLEEAIASSTAD